MSKFRVTVERTRREVVVIELEAGNDGAAETQALAKAREEGLDWELDDEEFDIRETTNEDTTEDLDEEDENEEEFDEFEDEEDDEDED